MNLGEAGQCSCFAGFDQLEAEAKALQSAPRTSGAISRSVSLHQLLSHRRWRIRKQRFTTWNKSLGGAEGAEAGTVTEMTCVAPSWRAKAGECQRRRAPTIRPHADSPRECAENGLLGIHSRVASRGAKDSSLSLVSIESMAEQLLNGSAGDAGHLENRTDSIPPCSRSAQGESTSPTAT